MLPNRGATPDEATARWSALGVAGAVIVCDVWAGEDLGTSSDRFTAEVPAREALLLAITAGEDRSPSVPGCL